MKGDLRYIYMYLYFIYKRLGKPGHALTLIQGSDYGVQFRPKSRFIWSIKFGKISIRVNFRFESAL